MTLKTWAHWLMDNDVFAYDPLGRLKVPRVQKIHRKPFTEQEARRLVAAAAGGPNPIRDRALLLVLFDSGCRVGELCAADVADVDLAQGTIAFRRTKNGAPRMVSIRVPNRRDGGPALSALRNWLKVREAREGVDALFTTREKLSLSTRRVREIFSELGQQARVPNCHPHRTRHSAATEFLAQRPGAEIQLRSRLGHLSKEVLNDYVSLSDPTLEEMAAVASLSTRWNL
jgi:site-specific recombinase XerC